MAEYRIVMLKEKKVAGLRARTANDDPEMGKTVGGLWQRLFGENLFFTLPHKVNDRSIGLYSDYGEDGYDITVGCEVASFSDMPQGVAEKTIPAGRYAEFTACGDDVQTVSKLWEEIWKTPLDRSYTGDFEEYYSSPEGQAREIRIYVALK